MGAYFPLTFNTHISFQSCNRHSSFSPTTFFEIAVYTMRLRSGIRFSLYSCHKVSYSDP